MGGVKMKHYTTKEQTAKLMGLGFAEPEAIFDSFFTIETLAKTNIIKTDEYGYTYALENYTIGDLIAFLEKYRFPTHIRVGGAKVNNVINQNYEGLGGELIDLLFNLCVKIKDGDKNEKASK